jgi:transposase
MNIRQNPSFGAKCRFMSVLAVLHDDQWGQIKEALPGKEGDAGQSATNNHQFIEAVIWMGRNGAWWRALPAACSS